MPHPNPTPSPTSLAWSHCAHGATTTDPIGCIGIHVPGHTACLAHLPDTDRGSYFAGLTPGANIDHRGTTFTQPLLNALLTHLRDPGTGHPSIGNAMFQAATFAGTTMFGSVIFTGDADFESATFTADAMFESATFTGDVWFGSVIFTGGATFASATFTGDVWFGSATFEGDATFASATFTGDAWFDSATFEDNATFALTTFAGPTWFDSATFAGPTWFESATFTGDVWFDSATFTGNAWFGSATFEGDATFASATFTGDAWFESATFEGDATFASATFTGDADFESATFEGSAEFKSARFVGEAEFESVTFAGDARFTLAAFAGSAGFAAVTFAGDAGFASATFAGTTWFVSATFAGDANFASATLAGTTWFVSATFAGDAWFGSAALTGEAWFSSATFAAKAMFRSATFTGDAQFDSARFTSDVNLELAVFEQAAVLGPLECDGRVQLSGAVFGGPVTLLIATRRLECQRTRWSATAELRLRYATVDLTQAVFEYPLTITAEAGPLILADGQPMSEVAFAGTPDAKVRMASVRGVDAAHLVLADVDLSRCLFTGTVHLDQLRLEGACSFDDVPSHTAWRHWRPVRFTHRRTLAEEHHWRAGQPAAVLGWNTAVFNAGHAGPAQLAPVYRALRKSYEDSKNEPGAADFYYGEMEMRRHDQSSATRAERGLLHGYWLLSGYGLRASRALGWLAAAMLITIVLLMGFGLPQDEPKQEATGTVPPGGGTVTFEIDKDHPQNPTSDRFSGKRFEKALNVTLNSVVFRSSGQDLTTSGTYIEMASRVTEPILLGLAVLAVRNRVKR